MDWKDVAKLIAPIAPMAGSIIGGFLPIPGGSMIGQKFGELVARIAGVDPTPEAVGKYVAEHPNEVVLATITAATERARIEVQGFVDAEKAYLHAVEVGLAQVNETMRLEIGHEHWYFTGWRPAAGWIFDFYSVVFGALLCVAAAKAALTGDAKPLNMLADAWPIFLSFFGALGMMVGVYVYGRTAEKGKALSVGTTATPPQVVKTVSSPVAKPVAKPAALATWIVSPPTDRQSGGS